MKNTAPNMGGRERPFPHEGKSKALLEEEAFLNAYGGSDTRLFQYTFDALSAVLGIAARRTEHAFRIFSQVTRETQAIVKGILS
ncbi:MAG: hypothetical protein ABJN26_25495 [Stappiaceae bacterium]